MNLFYKITFALRRKAGIILPLVILCASVVNATADNVVRLEFKNAKLEMILAEIGKQTSKKIFFKNGDLDPYEEVTIKGDYGLDEALRQALKTSDLEFEVLNSMIVIKRKEAVPEKTIVPIPVQDEKNTITGRVVSDTDEGLPGVNVFIKGTSQGTATDLEGNFTIKAPKSAILVFQSIGFKPFEVLVGNQSRIDVKLVPDTQQLNEVVVTAFGLERETKSLGYSVQEIKAEGMAEVRSENMMNSLSGKVAGLNIGETSGDIGGGVRVNIRGNTSLQGKNSPLWIIDGVPVNASGSDQDKMGSNVWGNNEGANALIDLNPDDIENISVLKGPNAAALYGARGANGVILVTTKGAKATDGMKIEYNANMQFVDPYEFFDFQNTYGQGSAGNYSELSLTSWGPKMEGQMVESWRDPGVMIPLSPHNQAEDFYEIGHSFTNSLVLSSGNEKNSVRISVMDSDNEGVTPEYRLHKNSVNLNFKQTRGKLNLSYKASYMRFKTQNKRGTGFSGDMMSFIGMPRSIRTEDLERSEDENGYRMYINPYHGANDPYFRTSKGSSVRNRFLGLVNADYKFNDWLTARVRVSTDMSHTSGENRSRPVNADQYKYMKFGSRNRSSKKSNIYNADALITAKKDISEFQLSASLGSSIFHQTWDEFNARETHMMEAERRVLGLGETASVGEKASAKEIQSLFAFGQVGYRNYLFLDLTARNDWSSALPNAYDEGYFYWSASSSLSVSDFLEDIGTDLPTWLTYAKLRASYATTGNDTGAGGTRADSPHTGFQVKQKGMKMVKGMYTTDKSIPIDPERTVSKEVGFDLRMFENRLGLDFTWYSKSTDNQIGYSPRGMTSGYTRQLVNGSEVRNRGIEISLQTRPVVINDFTWDLDLNFSKNRNEIVNFKGMDSQNGFKKIWGHDNLRIYAVEGGDLGELYGRTFKYNDDGLLIVDNKGLPKTNGQLDPQKEGATHFGSINPDWIGSVSNRFSYKGFYLNALVNIKSGGLVYSYTESHAARDGVSKLTLSGREEKFLVNGVVEVKDADGNKSYEPNTVKVSAQEYWSRVANNGRKAVVDPFLHDGSYVQLKELALGYNFPKKILGKTPFEALRLSFVATNVGFFSKDAPGNPFGFSSSLVGQAIEVAGMPMTRTYGFNLNVKF
ncbi:SusC/RagA family TonB-linked outer membrane protein [Fulvitalea axinellae]|uniref:SusC/RagA family TonB-linked outer membrane protein n=1 Tax=Fulvitalea axinellae TaxID=1182444 RepID=A0AAU9CXW9_9BACT|nr:SusC/RagA family TonB-linked outer membrane protein [Fulvitalea axinellae]